MKKIALIIAYNGEYFRGFQRQPGQYAVENVLEETLFRENVVPGVFSDKKVEYSSAGRTDKGVHAIYQVIAFNSSYDEEEVVDIINKELFPKITAWGFLEDIPQDFNARHWAKIRTYLYYLGVSHGNLTIDKLCSCTGLNRCVEIAVENILCCNKALIKISSPGFSRSEIKNMINCVFGKQSFNPGNLCLAYVGYPFKATLYFEYLRKFLRENKHVEILGVLEECFETVTHLLYFL